MIIEIANKQWQVTVASNYWEITQGLSGVESIPEWTGMYFHLGQSMITYVTTQDMLFPLDIAFISEGKVVDIARNVEPGNLISSSAYCDSFLEVNAGELEGVNVGDDVIMYFTEAPILQPGLFQYIMPIVVVGIMGAIGGALVKAIGEKKPTPTTAIMIPPTREIIVRGQVVKVVTVPGGSKWKCDKCGKDLAWGSQVAKVGKKVYCIECVREGYYADTETSVNRCGFMFQTSLDEAFNEAIKRVQGG